MNIRNAFAMIPKLQSEKWFILIFMLKMIRELLRKMANQSSPEIILTKERSKATSIR